jgi:hypothetical protein
MPLQAKESTMIKKIILSVAITTAFASPALAAQAGIAVGGGSTSSTSGASAASTGSSGSAIFGVTGQQSSAGANSNGSGTQLFNGNNASSTSNHTSSTTQQGTSGSIGLAGSQNANGAGASGQSSASGQFGGIWLFLLP